MWGPRSIAKLVYNSNFTMVYDTQITIVNGIYKPKLEVPTIYKAYVRPM